MAAYEHRILDQLYDKDGNLHINYPMTKSSCVKTEDGLLDDTLAKGLYVENGSSSPEEEEEAIIYNADRLEGKSSQYFENYADNTKNRTWNGNVIEQEYGGTGLVDFTPNSVVYTNSEGKITLLRQPSSDSFLIFKDGKMQWITLDRFKNILTE